MALRSDIIRRGAVYYFRRRLPTYAAKSLNRSHISFSLRTSCPRQARQRASRGTAYFEELFSVSRNIDEFTEADLKALADAAVYGYAEQHEAQRALGHHPSLGSENNWTATLDESIAAVRQNLKRNHLAYGPDDAMLLLDHLGVSYDQSGEAFRRLARLLEMATLRGYEIERRRHAGDYSDDVRLPDLAGCRSFTVADLARLFDEERNDGTVAAGAYPAMAGAYNGKSAASLETDGQPAASGSKGLSASAPISALRHAYVREREKGTGWSAKSSDQLQQTVDLFIEFMGDRPLHEFDRIDIATFKSQLLEVPSKYAQAARYRRNGERMTVQEVIAAARQNGETHFMTAKTINRHLTYLRGLFEWARTNGCGPTENPASEQSIKAKKSKKRTSAFASADGAWRQFQDDELRTFFFSPAYTGFSHANARHKPGDKIIKDARYFAPLIGAYSGMRREEVCQLHTDDIDFFDDVPCFLLRGGDGRHLKNDNAFRGVPIHPILIEAGLMEHWQRMCQRGERFLFPDLTYATPDGSPSPLAPDESYGTSIGKWFATYLDRIGLSDPGLVFHSFRHNVSNGLLNTSGVDPFQVKALLGHEIDGETHRTYFSGYEPRILAETISKLGYGFEDELRALFRSTAVMEVTVDPKPIRRRSSTAKVDEPG